MVPTIKIYWKTINENINKENINWKPLKRKSNAVKILEIKMNVSGATLFVEEHDKTFEIALDKAEDALKAQLMKYKQRVAQA